MNTTIQAPRFRSTTRLAQWVRRNKPVGRLSVESERCFLSGREEADKVSKNLLFYANYAGELGEHLESRMNDGEVPNYVRVLHTKGVPVPSRLLSRLDPERLVWASGFLRRLSDEFEAKIQDSSLMASYADNVGVLPERLEDVILGDSDSVVRYIKVLKTNFKEVPERFLRDLVGHDRHFVSLAQDIGRLPSYLEESIKDPYVAMNYAKYIIKGRLPEEVEVRVFHGSPRMAVRYGFEVVRGFASVRLPEPLHIALMLHPEQDSEIRKYIVEVDRTSEKPPQDGE